MNRFFRMFALDQGEPMLLDHVPVTDVPDWRAEKLKEAAVRHGKPFKCAIKGLPREVNGVDMSNVTKLPTRGMK